MILEESFGKSTDFISDGMNAFERNVKHIGDCLLAFIALVIFFPLFLIRYIAVRCKGGDPAIFKQEYIGRFGRSLNIYRSRSMCLDAEKFDPALYKGDAGPHMIRVGKFLCERRLDELPQLWNAFIGDMAFVGPRPERELYTDQIMERDPHYRFLYQTRPGVTSYTTFCNDYTGTLEKMLRQLCYDSLHLEHRSWWFDFKMLAKTFSNMVFGKKL